MYKLGRDKKSVAKTRLPQRTFPRPHGKRPKARLIYCTPPGKSCPVGCRTEIGHMVHICLHNFLLPLYLFDLFCNCPQALWSQPSSTIHCFAETCESFIGQLRIHKALSISTFRVYLVYSLASDHWSCATTTITSIIRQYLSIQSLIEASYPMSSSKANFSIHFPASYVPTGLETRAYDRLLHLIHRKKSRFLQAGS